MSFLSDLGILREREEGTVWSLGHHGAVLDRFYASRGFVSRLALTHTLKKHRGCVNTVTWSRDGILLIYI